jgi:hypothetical protein
MTLSVSQTTERRMKGWLTNDELESTVWNEVDVSYFKVLYGMK